MRPILLAAALLATAPATTPAWAEDDPALAARLYGALRLMTGGGAQAVTAERTGDTVTLIARSDQIEVGEPPQKLPFTWTLRERGDGTYAITGLSVPSPVIVKQDGTDPETRVPRTVTLSLEIPPITAIGTLDPSMKTAQSYDLRLEKLTGEIAVAEETGGSHGPLNIGAITSAMTMGPVTNGLSDIERHGSAQAIKADLTTPEGPIAVSLGSLEGRSVTHGANPAATLDAAEALRARIEAARGPDGKPDPAKLGPSMIKPLLAVLVSGGHDTDGVANLNDFSVFARDAAVAFHRFGLHFGTDTAGAATHGFMELSAEGITLPAPPQFADLIPQAVVFRPGVRGVDGQKLTRLADLASADVQDMGAIQAAALDLTSTPGAAFVIEALHVDLKDTRIDAHGEVRRADGGPIPAAADMEVRATGLDALIAKIQVLPEAQQILPALIYAKGLGKQEGGALVWVIHAEGAQVTVNGLPVMPGAQPAPPATKPRTPPLRH